MSGDPRFPESSMPAAASEPEALSAVPPEPHDAAGAYVLDALPRDERQAFVWHLATCPDCRRAVAEMAPVVGLLPRLYGTTGAAPGATLINGAAATDVTPDRRLRDRIIAAATSDRIAPPGAPVGPAPVAPAAPPPPVPIRSAPRFGAGWAVAAVLALVAAGALAWALVLSARLDDRQTEVVAQRAALAAQAREIESLQQRPNAVTYALAPTADGPDDAVGQMLYALGDRFGVLYFRGLPALPDDQVYQLWYLEGDAALPGDVFSVGDDGIGSLAITTDVSSVDAVALTVEPAGGSEDPTSAVILSGELGDRPG